MDRRENLDRMKKILFDIEDAIKRGLKSGDEARKDMDKIRDLLASYQAQYSASRIEDFRAGLYRYGWYLKELQQATEYQKKLIETQLIQLRR